MATVSSTTDQANISVDLNSEGNNFDPSNFMNSIFQAIDSNRSDIGQVRNDIVINPEKYGKGTSGETRINTFLRLLGMPAVRDETLFNPQALPKQNDLSQNNTLNYFSSAAALADAVGQINSRNDKLGITPSQEDYNQIVKDPLSIDCSVSDDAKNVSRRSRLFPLVVDASVPVFSLDRRVAPLFNDGDYVLLGGKARLKRPFLQHIIYMRTKVYSGGALDLQAQTDLQTNILNTVGPGIITPFDLANFKILELRVIQKFIEALKQSAKKYNRAKSDLKSIQSKISYNFQPVAHPEQRSGSSTIDPTDPTAFTTSIDRQIQDANVGVQTEDLFLLTLPVELVNRSDKIRRLEDQTPINNVSPDAFINEFTSLLSFDREVKNDKLTQLKQEKKRLAAKLEQGRRDMCYYTGEFYGLSIFDVLCVFYGLFTVDLSVLISLLNQSARSRLLKDPFYSVQNIDLSTEQFDFAQLRLAFLELMPVPAALALLEIQVKKGFQIATTFLQNTASTVRTTPNPIEN